MIYSCISSLIQWINVLAWWTCLIQLNNLALRHPFFIFIDPHWNLIIICIHSCPICVRVCCSRNQIYIKRHFKMKFEQKYKLCASQLIMNITNDFLWMSLTCHMLPSCCITLTQISRKKNKRTVRVKNHPNSFAHDGNT